MTDLPKRPGRGKMPSLQRIHEYWVLEHHQEANDWFGQVDVGEPSCYACGWWDGYNPNPDPWAGFHRAHIIDRWEDGLDLASNLTLLCLPCHRQMPGFSPGEEELAIGWIQTRPYWMTQACHPKDSTQMVADHLTAWVKNHGEPALAKVREINSRAADMITQLLNQSSEARCKKTP